MTDDQEKRVLLIQVRAPDDPMLDHEVACVSMRFGDRQIELARRNALVDVANANWLDGVDGVVIGGSGDFSVHHPKSQPWVTPLRLVLDGILNNDIPCFAICFGHQLLGQHLGRPVITDPSHAELGTVHVELTEAGRRSALFSQFQGRFHVHSGHSDHVSGVPVGVDLLASNAATKTQAFHVRGTRVYSVQFHPDMTGAEARYRYLAYRQGFAKRLDPSAESKADMFLPDQDESAVLLGRFFDVCMAQQE
ncbi:MAG: type 1 glutamine amidotransferase [Myxococcota bacterium]|nr:type 1 glutamine amidotransferase [Myxococcota bacterium]